MEVSLHDYFESKIAALREFVEQHIETSRRERDLVAKAYEESERKTAEGLNQRLEGFNKFREQLREQAASFITRETYEQALNALELRYDAQFEGQDKRITALETDRARLYVAGIILMIIVQLALRYVLPFK